MTTTYDAPTPGGMKEPAPAGCIDPLAERRSGGLVCLKDNEIGYVRGRRTDMRPGVNMVSSNRPFSTIPAYLQHIPEATSHFDPQTIGIWDGTNWVNAFL